MRLPVTAQNVQRQMRQRDEAILRTDYQTPMAAAMHVSLHMFGIDVADLQAECFALAQPGRTHGPAVGSIARLPDGGDESMHFVDALRRWTAHRATFSVWAFAAS